MENKDLPSVPSNPHRVIQPVSDMSEYKPKEPAEPAKPAAHAAPDQAPARPIYPDAKRDAQTEPTSPVPHTNQTKSYVNDDAAAARVPILRVYAIVNIVYALYLAYKLITAGADVAAIVQSVLLGATAFHLIIGAYLLTARDLRVVSGLLLGLIISDGLAVLNVLVAFAQSHSHLRLGILLPYLISIGLLVFTWYTRTKVDLASVEP